MSMHTTPILYLNMGGEMLYVLQQRLTAQRIDNSKSVQVLDDVTAALLNPKILSTVFEPCQPTSVSCIRSTLECVSLSSIMRLDKASMNKLFDLMIMLIKYQLTVATGPREMVLMTLNHIDAMREIVIDQSAHECINLVHQMTVNLYGNMTMGQVWQTRNDCLKVLDHYCVRVSVLLRLGLQNSDGSFNIRSSQYDEKYTKYQDMLDGIKLNDTDCENCSIGSFALFGNRITILGRNIYSSSYGQTKRVHKQQSSRDYGIRTELKMLEAQLGVEEVGGEKIFNLNLFTDDENINDDGSDNVDESGSEIKEETNSLSASEDPISNTDYKSTLNNKYADFVVGENDSSVSLLDLLDKVE